MSFDVIHEVLLNHVNCCNDLVYYDDINENPYLILIKKDEYEEVINVNE